MYEFNTKFTLRALFPSKGRKEYEHRENLQPPREHIEDKHHFRPPREVVERTRRSDCAKPRPDIIQGRRYGSEARCKRTVFALRDSAQIQVSQIQRNNDERYDENHRIYHQVSTNGTNDFRLDNAVIHRYVLDLFGVKHFADADVCALAQNKETRHFNAATRTASASTHKH